MRAVWRRLPPTALGFDAGKLLTRTLLRPASVPSPVAFEFSGQVPMTVDLGELTGNDLFCLDRCYESLTLRLWRALAARAETVVDVGSHVGTFAAVAAVANPSATVVAVEPLPGNVERLRQNCARFGNVVVLPFAVATSSGPASLEVDVRNAGGGRLVSREEGSRTVRVTSLTLGDVCRGCHLRSVDLLKLDVEGYEASLLAAEGEFWEAWAPAHVIVEIAAPDRRGIAAIVEVMTKRGYGGRPIQSLLAFPALRRRRLENWHFWRTPSDGPGA